jgi:MFS superfamily sulfate permease-like transporter
MSDAAGGRTQMTGLVTAATIGLVLLFFTGPLQYVPIAALGAVLVKAALSLVDLPALKIIYKIDRREFGLSILSTLGVVAVGAIHAILIAVVLAVVRFVRLVSRPKIEILGRVKGFSGFHSVERHPEAATIPGLLLLRFNAPIVFFNAPYFKREVLAAVVAAGPTLKWLVLDMIPITMIDATGLYTAEEVADTLHARGVVLAAAGRKTEWNLWADSRGRALQERKIPIYTTLSDGIEAFQSKENVSATLSEFGELE